jgi:hypothetical protein
MPETMLINYRTGQKGSTLANFLSFGHTSTNPGTGASEMLRGTERLKWWFYHGVYDRLAGLGHSHPSGKPPPSITWEEQRLWFEDPGVADVAYDGMLETLEGVSVPCISMQHLPMLGRGHIDDLRSRGYVLWGIHTKPERVRQIELENHFKTADRDYVTEQHRQASREYLASKGIHCPPGRPEKEIDTYCVERDLSPTDENRVLVMEKLIAMSNRPGREIGHTLVRCNDAYQRLGIPTIDYDDLFYPPYPGIERLQPGCDLGAWHSIVSDTWVPERVEMFGRTWDTRSCGYDPVVA